MLERLIGIGGRRRKIFLGAAILVVGSLGFAAVRLARSRPSIPMADVQRGEFVERVQLRGEIKAMQSVLLTAPSGAGDIQIVKLAHNGTPVKKGEVVIEFDITTLQSTLDQKRSELKQAEAEIEGSRAQARLQEEQDQTDLVHSRYDVERARLDTTKEEVISKIDAEKYKLTLADAQQKLREVEQKLNSDRAGAAADLESHRQKREKALFEVRQAERNIAAMTLKAPVDGLVTLLPNWRARGWWGGGNAPEFKEGDRAWPGAAIAELPNLATLRVAVRVDETDRGRLKPGQSATIRVDAVPDKEFAAQVEAIGELAKLDFSGWPPAKNFDLALQLAESDSRLRPGMSTTARVAVDRVPNSILIPVEAVFQKGGRTVAYALRGAQFEERVIEVARRNGSQAMVARGLKPGEQVALRDPVQEGMK